MARLRPLLVPLTVVALGVAIQLTVWKSALYSQWAAPDGPRSFVEVIQIATRAGLHHRSQHINEKELRVNCLAVSVRPLSWTDANCLCVNKPDHPCWDGTVAVYGHGHYVANYDPECSVVWGNMFVYGDRDVIHRLTGKTFGECAR
jgi:hypothetical protein